MPIIINIIQQGLIFSLVAMAVYLTSRVINKDDLGVEGTFGFGGAITALFLSHSLPPIFAIAASMLAGALLGGLTGVLYTRLKMNHLMAGLVTTTACFSLSLVLASANKNVDASRTIFAGLHMSPLWAESIVLPTIAIFALIALRLFLRSELGLLMRAAGDNPSLLLYFGKSKNFYQALAYIMSNALTALAGSLFVQWSGFFSITGNIGTLITGLASLMIAELFIKKLSVVILVAAIAYQSIFAITLWLGVSPVWNNLSKAAIIIILVAIAQMSNARKESHA
jgi:putative ABC transport system permease protein